MTPPVWLTMPISLFPRLPELLVSPWMILLVLVRFHCPESIGIDETNGAATAKVTSLPSASQ